MKERISYWKDDLKNKDHNLLFLKKQFEDIKDSIEEGKIESTVISQKIVKLIENLNYLLQYNQQAKIRIYKKFCFFIFKIHFVNI